VPLIAVIAWAFALADSRGATAGLAAGLLALGFFAAPRRWKAIPILLAAGLTVGGWFYSTQSVEGRSMYSIIMPYALIRHFSPMLNSFPPV
jgi:hypothetical protein